MDCPPLPPGARQTPSGRVSCSYCKFARQADIFRKKVGASPGGARRAGSEGERGRGKAREERGVAQNLGKYGGGGGSDMIQFVRRPGVSDETRGGLDTVSHLTPGGPQADLETTNREGLQNH